MAPRPTHVLRHEHRVIERSLRAINGMCLRLRLGDPVPATALRQFLEFTKAYADRYHHEREEKHLFPALAAAGVETGAALDFLRDEHALERQLLDKLEAEISSFNPECPEALERLIDTSERFSRHLIGHMQREDSLLFRMAEELLDENSKVDLMRALNEDDHESNEGYEHLAEKLESTWAV